MTARSGGRVVHIDLSQPSSNWIVEADGRRVLLVFWWRSLALGQRHVDANELPLLPGAVAGHATAAIGPAVGYWLLGKGFESWPADIPPNGVSEAPELSQLASLQSPLSQLDGVTQTAARTRTLRVVVCTRDRPEALAVCLDALLQSHLTPDELVVVDNAPTTAATKQVVEARPSVRYVLERRPGLSCARNAGLRDCTTELVAYTDDDVVVHPDWTQRLQLAFADAQVVAMTGLVLPASIETEAEWLFESKIGGFSQGFRPFVAGTRFVAETRRKGVPVWRLGAGANMAFKRLELLAAGGFDERLGAGAAGCSEDSEVWYRLLVGGASIAYDPRAVVYHAHRADLTSLRRQMWLYMRGHVAALLVQFEKTGDWGNLLRLAVLLPWYYVRRVVWRITSTRARTPSLLSNEILGAIAGVGYYLRHRWDARASALTDAPAPNQ